MNKRIKILIFLSIGFLFILLVPISNVYASTYDDLIYEINANVDAGVLPEYHRYLAESTGYQTYYMKAYKMNDEEGREYFKSLSYGRLQNIIQNYENKWNEVWYDVLNNLDVEAQYLDQDRILGLYYDSDAINNETSKCSYLYLLWTSRYIPSEFMTVSKITVNGKTYNQYPTNDLFNPKWYETQNYHFPKYDLSLHKTIIAGFETGEEKFGIPLTQVYAFSNIKYEINKLEFYDDPDPGNFYSGVIDTDATFNLGIEPTYFGKSICQLVTHAYKLIKDCEVQSHYDFGFGGYMHYVHFNTSIPIDRIYRVDVSYILTSDNKSWYQFWLYEDEKRIIKSMKPEKRSTGIFGLYNTYGFKEGEFKSNKKDSITYKYEMMLNYKEQNWDIFGDYCLESNYKRIKDFKILRLNYVIDSKTYDVKVDMDTVDGETKSIVDRDLILDTDSTIYKVKDKAYTIADGISYTFSLIKNILLISLAVIGGLLIIYVGYKLVITIKEVLENDS